MKNDKWFYEAQRLFKKWKVENSKSSDTAKQVITNSYYEEYLNIYPINGGRPEGFVLHAFKNTGEVYLLPSVGKPIRIVLRKHKGYDTDL